MLKNIISGAPFVRFAEYHAKVRQPPQGQAPPTRMGIGLTDRRATGFTQSRQQFRPWSETLGGRCTAHATKIQQELYFSKSIFCED